jgi:hypothetical protein
MIFRRRPPADPLDTGRLLCAYCTSDWLEWERAPSGDSPAPPLNPAVTVLPATVEGQAGGAAICAGHLRPLLRTRRLMAERRGAADIPVRNGATAAQRDAPMPRIMPEAAQA